LKFDKLTDRLSNIKKNHEKSYIRLTDDICLTDDALKKFMKNKDNLELPFRIKVSILEKQNNKIIDFFYELLKNYSEKHQKKTAKCRELVNTLNEHQMRLRMSQSAFKEN